MLLNWWRYLCPLPQIRKSRRFFKASYPYENNLVTVAESSTISRVVKIAKQFHAKSTFWKEKNKTKRAKIIKEADVNHFHASRHFVQPKDILINASSSSVTLFSATRVYRSGNIREAWRRTLALPILHGIGTDQIYQASVELFFRRATDGLA